MHQVVSDTLGRKQGQSTPLPAQMAQAAGVIKGGVLGGEAMKALTTAMRSPAWGTVAAIWKDRLADAIAKGDHGPAEFAVQKIVADPAMQKTKGAAASPVYPAATITPDAEQSQAAGAPIVAGAAALTPAERSIADSRRVSVSTLDDIARRLEDKGTDATLAQVLEGKAGTDVLSNLVSDGVISPQERAALTSEDKLTKAGKDRISSLMLGRFFSDPAQMENIAPSVRNKVERIAAPLARTEGQGGFDLAPDVRTALDLVEDADAHGAATIDDHIAENGLFGQQQYSPQAIAIAKQLRTANPTDLTNAVRKYADHAKYAREYQGPGMFGDFPAPLTPAAAFIDAFGTPAVGDAGPAVGR